MSVSEHSNRLPFYAVIMAGGSGERFWPASRMNKPKQLLPLGANGITMLEEAIHRIAPIIPYEHILLITGKNLQESMVRVAWMLPAGNVIAEPCKRNTAPCLALAAAEIIAREGSGQALMAVLTADHFIGNAETFRQDVTDALSFAERHHALVTIGVTPSRPETGYGYIEVASNTSDGTAIPVQAFREKPSRETAMEYLHDGRHYWNSGMFFWRVDALHQAMVDHLPEVGGTIKTMSERRMVLRNSETLPSDQAAAAQTLDEVFATMPDISIDYGVMERANNVAVVPAGFVWDDVGSWDALTRLGAPTEQGNVTVGDVVDVECANSIVVNNGADGHVVGTIGVEDLVVVVTPDATLVCPRNKAQDVKKVVAALRNRGRTDVL